MDRHHYDFDFTTVVNLDPDDINNCEFEEKIIYLEDIINEVRFQLTQEFEDTCLYSAEAIAHKFAEDIQKKGWGVL